MKKAHILIIGILTYSSIIAQAGTTKTFVAGEASKVTKKVKDTMNVTITTTVTEKITSSEVLAPKVTVTESNTIVTTDSKTTIKDSIPAKVLSTKKTEITEIAESTSKNIEEPFSFEGKNNGQIFLKKVSGTQILIFEDFATEELKTKMLSLTKKNVSDIINVVYRPKMKEIGSKRLEGDGEQMEITSSVYFEMLSATLNTK